MLASSEKQFAELELTVPQATLLRSLDTPLPRSRLAEALRCDTSNVTGTVDRLEARGLVQRRVRAADRRVKEIVLTPEGRRLKRRIEGAMSGVPGLSRRALAICAARCWPSGSS